MLDSLRYFIFPEGPPCPSPEAQIAHVSTKMTSLSSTATQVQGRKHETNTLTKSDYMPEQEKQRVVRLNVILWVSPG